MLALPLRACLSWARRRECLRRARPWARISDLEARKSGEQARRCWISGSGTAESGEAGEDAIRDLGLGLELSVAFKLAFSGEFGAVGREMASAQDRGGLSGRIWHYMLGIGESNCKLFAFCQ